MANFFSMEMFKKVNYFIIKVTYPIIQREYLSTKKGQLRNHAPFLSLTTKLLSHHKIGFLNTN